MKPLSLLAIFAVMLALAGCSSLARKTILPGPFLKPPQSTIAASPRYELLSLPTSAGRRIAAQFGVALDEHGTPLHDYQTRPTILFFYGNRMCLAASQDIMEDFRRMGANVMIPEYPGYGMSEGTASEQACYDAADTAFGYLLLRPDIDHQRIVVAGLSIGCGPAVDLCSRKQVAGLVMIVPLSNIREVGSDIAPWYLDWAVPLLSHNIAFDNRAKISRVKCPILLVMAEHDQVTSAKRSDELATAAKSPLERVVVNSDHDGSWQAGRNNVEKWMQTLFAEARPQSCASQTEQPVTQR